jgi:hypothetical protein
VVFNSAGGLHVGSSIEQPGHHAGFKLHVAVVPCCMCLQVGVAVYQVLPKEEEAMSARTPSDDTSCTTRLVIPDDVISSSMIRCGWQISQGSCWA